MHFFAVCDGHGENGGEVSSFLKFSLPGLLHNVNLENDAHQEMENVFLKVHDDLINYTDCNLSGSTCCSLLLNGRYLLSANVGDSRAIIVNS